MAVADLRAEPYGASAVLIWCSPEQTEPVVERARAQWPLAREIVPAGSSVMVEGIADIEAAIAEIATWSVSAPALGSGPVVDLETIYDGPDLADVAAFWSVDRDEVARIHSAPLYVVAFCGFAPGFAYCTGLGQEHAVPRRSSPRARVAPGSVGIADAYTGVYPTASPGGWQLIGRTEASLWDLSREEPALLIPGMSVRFVPR